MMIVQRFMIAVVTLIGLISATPAEEEKVTQVQMLRELWSTRAKTELANVNEEERASAAISVLIAIAGSGEIELAKAITQKYIPPQKQPKVILIIADTQSQLDQLEDALATVKEMETDFSRQAALGIVAVRQAQRGDIDDAISILSKISRQYWRDYVLGSIAEAQAISGDMDAARATTKKIVDKELKLQAQEAIKTAKADPIRKIPSQFLRGQIGAMLAFSGRERQHEAINAIAAAQRMDKHALKKYTKAALVEAEKGIPLERATTRTLLAVALVESGQREEAKKMILQARKANKDDRDEWLGVSDLMGSPILVHLLIRLDLDEDLKSLMNSFDKVEAFDRLPYQSNLQAIGGTYAYLNRLDDAEKYYKKIKTPLDRVYLAAGVLMGLQQSKSSVEAP